MRALALQACGLVLLASARAPRAAEVYLPTHSAAQEALAAGDRARESAHELADPLARRAGLATAFDAWWRALEQSASGDAVPATGAALRALGEGARLGVEEAVWLRLAELEASERAQWSERMDAIARERSGSAAIHATSATVLDATGTTVLDATGTSMLDATGSPSPSTLAASQRGPTAEESLRALERNYPRTRAAAEAALALADLAHERARGARAQHWLARARRHAADQGPPALLQALAARAAVYGATDDSAAATRERSAAGLAAANGLRALGALALPLSAEGARIGARLGRFLRPGMCALPDGRLCVQAPERLAFLTREGTRLSVLVDPGALLTEACGLRPGWAPGRVSPGWQLSPSSGGGLIFLVHGRSMPSGAPNALLALRPPAEHAAALDPASLPRVAWAVAGERWWPAPGQARTHPLLAGFEQAELQPAPLALGGQVLVQVRVESGAWNAWLLALDATSGEPLWRCFLARGDELVADLGRGAPAPGLPSAGSAEPLVAAGGAVLAGTSLGAGAACSALDGRMLWAASYARRAEPELDWQPSAGRAVQGEPGRWAWAPADAQALALVPTGIGEPEPSWPPLERVELEGALFALGADGRCVRFGARVGAGRRLVQVERARGLRVPALELGAPEDFSCAGTQAGARALAVTQRALYLFDTARDGYLLASAALESAGERATDEAASLWLTGARAHVLGRDSLRSFELVP